jgi:hypothetical protein
MDSTAPAEPTEHADRIRALRALIADAKARGGATAHLEHALAVESALASGDTGRIEKVEERSGRPILARPRPASWSMNLTAKPALALVGRQAARPRERRDSGCRRSGSRRTSRATRAGPSSDPDLPPRSPAALEGVAG